MDDTFFHSNMCGLVIGLGDDVYGFRSFPPAGFLALLAFEKNDIPVNHRLPAVTATSSGDGGSQRPR
jgi:hypothetical protein